jgi:hypothetical protein
MFLLTKPPRAASQLRTREADLENISTAARRRSRSREGARNHTKRLEEDASLPELGSAKDFPLIQALNKLKGQPVLVSKTAVGAKQEREKTIDCFWVRACQLMKMTSCRVLFAAHTFRDQHRRPATIAASHASLVRRVCRWLLPYLGSSGVGRITVVDDDPSTQPTSASNRTQAVRRRQLQHIQSPTPSAPST